MVAVPREEDGIPPFTTVNIEHRSGRSGGIRLSTSKQLAD
jgi:hypothetical protein